MKKAKEPVKAKTIQEQLEEMAQEICDGYCKFKAVYREEEFEFLWDEVCPKCPMSRLI